MAEPSVERVIVLGIDGLDPKILEALMAQGRAPAFARLCAEGAYRRLGTAMPPQSPVVWSTLAVGSGPGHHGVFDFIRRDPRRYLPELAVLRPNPRNLLGRRASMFLPARRGTAFWSVTSDAGIPTSVVRWPLTLPPEKVNGHMLAGLGVPDIRGSLGRYTLYTTRDVPASEARKLKGDVLRLPPDASTVHARLPGPEGSFLPMQLRIDQGARRLMVYLPAQQLDLEGRQWSDWVRVRFKVHHVRTVKGICRFYLSALAPHVELYLSPVQADPADPAFLLSHPDGYASELAEAVGDYHTLGMPEDANALRDGSLDADAFLGLCETVTAERERMLWHEVAALPSGLLAFVFDTADRLQHVFWRTRDRGHPAYEEPFARRYGTVIEDHYRRMDGIVGRLLDGLGGKTALIVLSDHGFASFRRAVHLNAWLVENGLMALKDPSGGGEGFLLRNVDWRRTRAYALGFSSLYLNLEGREREGIVPAGEAAALKERIAGMLSKLIDPSSGDPVVERVCAREEVFPGPFLEEAPDLTVGFKPGYRASWQTAVGAGAPCVVEDNRESWSGDHIVDPSHVPGVFFINRAVAAAQVGVRDLAPTVLRLFGLAAPPGTEGRSLLDQEPAPPRARG